MKCLLAYLALTISVLVCGQDLPTVKAEIGNEDSFENIFVSLNGGCSLSCAIGWTLSTSSTLKTQADNLYVAKNMDDGKRYTAWVEGKDGYGIGERIVIKFEGPESLRNISFRAIEITNGYAKNIETWKANSRVKLFKLLFNGIEKLKIELVDSIYPQYISLPEELHVSSGDEVTLEIAEVFEGEKYKDTAISDISLDGAH